MKIPKKQVQEKMEYFLRTCHGERGYAEMLLAWAFLKDWVDHYDVPEEINGHAPDCACFKCSQ